MFKNGLINGSIMNTAQSPRTTDGIAAKSSIIIPITSLMYLGIIFSVINIAVPTPNGIAINSETRNDQGEMKLSGRFKCCINFTP